MTRDVGRIGSRQRTERNRRILANTTTCHICGQPGADAIDHVIPVVECLRRGIDPEHPSNLRPAHHNVEPKCNRVKYSKPFAPIVRRSRSLQH